MKQAKPRFYLDSSKKDKALLILSYTYRPNMPPVRYSTRQFIEPGEWDSKAQEPKNLHRYATLNRFLSDMKAAAVQIVQEYRDAKNGKDIRPKDYKQELDYRMGFAERPQEKKVIPDDIAGFTRWYVDHKRPKVSDGYLRMLKVTARKLREFLEDQHFEFADIGPLFWNRYRSFWSQQGLTVNYINKKIKQTHLIFLEASRHGLLIYNNGSRPTEKVQDESLYFELLTEQELQGIAQMSLPPFRAKCRDLFLLGCYTGQRVGDYTRIEAKHIRKKGNEEMIVLVQQKTGKTVYIPILPEAREILQRYGMAAPTTESGKPISPVHINREIKEICREYGLTQPVHIERQRAVNGRLQSFEETLPKYQTISSHYGRRWFCTHFYKKGAPIAAIMAITGHTKETTFLRYINMDKEENAKDFLKYI